MISKTFKLQKVTIVCRLNSYYLKNVNLKNRTFLNR